MKKLLSIALVAILAIVLAVQMIPHVFAAHDADVDWILWDGSKTKTLTRPEFPDPLWPWVNFSVYNWASSSNAIVKFKFLIPKTDTGYAKFKYWESVIHIAGWSATPDEFDNDGWATVIIFETWTNPIKPGNSAVFDLKFTNARVTVCSHTFTIYTIDDGSPPETKPHELYLVVDPDAPSLVMIHPTEKDGASETTPIYAIFDPYPLNWYMWINFTADDATGEHDTGISLVEVYMDGKQVFRLPEKDYYEPPVKKPLAPDIVFKERLYHSKFPMPTGWHTIKVVVWDGARNSKTFTHRFYFLVPSYFRITPESGTVGRDDNTYNPVTGEWSGSISDVYGEKQLGTRVTVEGLQPPSPLAGFTPNSWVDIYVYHPYHGRILVRNDVPTGTGGTFKTSFLFPKGPYGYYKVEAVDAKGITDFTYFKVVQEIIYKPEIVTGPAVVEAIASGLTVGIEGNARVDRFMIDDTDALLTVNMHVVNFWYSDEWGVLWTDMAYKQGFLLPILENGKYIITLRIPGYYWDGITGDWKWLDMEVENEVHVANDFAALLTAMDELELKLDYIKPKIDTINDNVATIKTDVGTIKTDVKDIIQKIIIVNGTVARIETKVGTILGYVDDINWNDIATIKNKVNPIDWNDVIAIRTNVGNIWAKIQNINLTGIQTDVGFIKTNMVTPPDVSMGISLAAVLSAIAAIASITAVVVVVRRLKVAA